MREVEIRGDRELIRRLQQLGRQVRPVAAGVLQDEAENDMTEMKRRTPVDTGTLRSSGTVASPKIESHGVSVQLSFGGAAAPYAEIVHENLRAHHPSGRAKYVESVVIETQATLGRRLAQGLRRRLGL